MLRAFVGALDKRLADRLLAGALRNWPVLTVVPSTWLRPLLLPTARRLRRSLVGRVLSISLALVVAILLLALLG